MLQDRHTDRQYVGIVQYDFYEWADGHTDRQTGWDSIARDGVIHLMEKKPFLFFKHK